MKDTHNDQRTVGKTLSRVFAPVPPLAVGQTVRLYRGESRAVILSLTPETAMIRPPGRVGKPRRVLRRHLSPDWDAELAWVAPRIRTPRR